MCVDYFIDPLKETEMKKSTIATEKFPAFNCSQSVFSSFAEDLKIDEATALKLSSGFGGGMACAETCGAVTGAYMVIGMKHGHAICDPDAKAFTKTQIKKFNELFIKKNGSLICKELLGVDISTEEGAAKANSEELFGLLCPGLVESACDILEEEF